ncbi:hypothetical protein [Acidithiobacillus sp.]
MWERQFDYQNIVFCTKDKNDADRNRTKQELLFFNILLPKVVPVCPVVICKGESPDFTVHLPGGERLYVEVVTAVAVAHEIDGSGRPGINQEHRWAQIRDGKRENKSYTTDDEELALLVAREIKKKQCLAKNWNDKRPIILLVGLVGAGGLLLGFDPQKHVQDIQPFKSIVVGDGTSTPYSLRCSGDRT